VLDEILAFWLVLLLILPAPFWMQVLAFALFRFFDAVKPGPIGTIDRYFKDCVWIAPGSPTSIATILWRGFGIVIDDLAAAFATLLILALLSTTQLLPSF
jgi:phosphatidylglycerophosphatase A